MKSKGVLNIELSRLITKLGHGDMIAIVDRGFPVPYSNDIVCIDLAIGKNLPTVKQVLEVILDELVIEKKIFAKETIKTSKHFYDDINKLLDQKGIKIEEELLEHDKFKKAILSDGFNGNLIRAYIRTGEFTFYGNIVLVAGVNFS